MVEVNRRLQESTDRAQRAAIDPGATAGNQKRTSDSSKAGTKAAAHSAEGHRCSGRRISSRASCRANQRSDGDR